jgi:RNA:NAD 2'-phosphotransferase (TPT1/KptA family)
MYHATPTANVEKIMRDGLIGYLVGEPVHLSDDPYDAAGVAGTVHDTDDITTFEVCVEGLILNPGYDGPGTYTVVGDVIPSRLKVWRM